MRRWTGSGLEGIVCRQCGKFAPRTGPRQLYCATCSAARAKQNQARYDYKHKISPEKLAQYRARKKTRIALKGIEISEEVRSSLVDAVRPLEFAWMVRVKLPFSWAASKNRVYTRGHHIALREEVRQYRAMIATTIRAAVNRGGTKIVQNKVWLTFFVQKLANKGDAINVVDTVCDALVDALGIDDRWFCIHRLDWEIVKKDPCIFIGIAQEDVPPVQACSSCGRLLTFENFTIKRSNKNGISRTCRDCLTGRYDVKGCVVEIEEM